MITLSKVAPMTETPAQYQQRMDRLMAKLERQFTRRLVSIRNEYGAAAIMQAVKTGLIVRDEIYLSYVGAVYDALEWQTRRVIPVFWKVPTDGAKSALPTRYERKDESNIDAFIQQWLTQYGLEKSTLIAETAYADVIKAARDIMASRDFSTREVEKALRDFFGLSRYRATTIAATETHQAAMYAVKESAVALQSSTGLRILKAWSSVKDGRTREWHYAMDSSNKIAMDSKFNVDGDLMDRPGDPSASARNLVRCRCALLTIPVTS